METVNPIEYASLDEIVFETRNRSYGAYLLRKSYHYHLGVSLLIATAICLMMVHLPKLLQRGDSKANTLVVLPKDSSSELTLDPPLIERIKPKASSVRQIRVSTPNLIPQTTAEDIQVPEVKPELTFVPGMMGPVEVDGNDPDFNPGDQKGTGEELIEIEEDNKIHLYVGEMPEFPGGNAALIRFLKKHMRYPQVAQRMGVEGKVFLQFVVSRDGSITEVQVVKGISKECDEEAMRVVKAMPTWQPGKQNGMPVAVRYTFPVFFKMSE